MKYITGILMMAILFLSSCKQEMSNEHDHNHNKELKDTNNPVEHQHSNNEETLHLNNGSKWIANKATQEGMTKIKNILSDYQQKNSSDHKTLATAMSKESSRIISNCDMTGEDHDQLHVILVPILNDIDNIKKSASNQPLIDLANHLNEYFAHFKMAN